MLAANDEVFGTSIHPGAMQVVLHNQSELRDHVRGGLYLWQQAIAQYQNIPGMDVAICAAVRAFDERSLTSRRPESVMQAYLLLAKAQHVLGNTKAFVEAVSCMSDASRRLMNFRVFHVRAGWKEKAPTFRLRICMYENGSRVKTHTTLAYSTYKDGALNAFMGDLQNLADYTSPDFTAEATPVFESLLPMLEAQIMRMINTLHPQSSKLRRVSTAREHALMVPGLGKRERQDFFTHGHVVLDKKLPSDLVDELLKWHKKNMSKKTGRVHSTKGAKTLTWTDAPCHKRGLTFGDRDAEPKLRKLAKFIAGEVGRSPDALLKHVHLLQFSHGQIPQEWHQDSPFDLVGATVHLTKAKSTEFLSYEGKDQNGVRMDQRRKFCKEKWDVAKSSEAEVQHEGRELEAGSVVVFNTGHIHRAPAPPEEGEPDRRVIFMAFESDIVDAESVTIFSHNSALALPGARAKVRRSQDTQREQEAQQDARVAAAVAADAANSATKASNEAALALEIETFAHVLTDLRSRVA